MPTSQSAFGRLAEEVAKKRGAGGAPAADQA
jgi:hypothetical protein